MQSCYKLKSGVAHRGLKTRMFILDIHFWKVAINYIVNNVFPGTFKFGVDNELHNLKGNKEVKK